MGDHIGQTRLYRRVSGQPDVRLWRNCNFLTKDDDLEKCILELRQTATIKPRQIERSVFFYWTKTDKLEYKDWFEPNRDLVLEKLRFSD